MKMEDILKRPHGVVTILGMRGCGKTYLSSNTEFPSDVMVIYIDVVGVFPGYVNAYHLECDKLPSQDLFSKVMKKCLADERVKRQKKIIFDISQLNRDDMVTIVNWLSDFLFYQRVPGKYAVVADEVGEYMEQEHGYYAQSFERLVRMGRNKGIMYMLLITQRPQKVNKHILTLSEYYIVFKFIHNLDLNAVREILGKTNNEFMNTAIEIKGLGVGEYMLTDGLSEYWNLRKREKVIHDAETGQTTITELERPKTDEPVYSGNQSYPQSSQPTRPVARIPRSSWSEKEDSELISLRKSGLTFSKVAVAMGKSYHQVTSRYRQLRLMGKVKK